MGGVGFGEFVEGRVGAGQADCVAGQGRELGEQGLVAVGVLAGGGALPSLILWGAPGTGKTTLARLLADSSGLRFIALSAVFSGVKDLREAIQEASEEAARLLVDQWNLTPEEAYVFLSVTCDVNICQACHPSPFSTIARVSIPKVDATPRPFA